MVVLGLMNGLLQPCALAATLASDTTQAEIAHRGHHADLAQQVGGKLQIPCASCEYHESALCDDPLGEDCSVADETAAGSTIKPKDRSPDLSIISLPTRAAIGSFSWLPAAHTPAPILSWPTGPSLNIRFCVYLK